MPTSMSLRLPQTLADQLGQLAETTGRSKSFLMIQALEDFLAREAWQVAEIKKGLAEADAGDFASADEIQAIDAKWGRRRAD
ncbi:CopG family ribbon-helix-helix protein [Solidesulfovibrio alcoholivorans]|uniref:CopG family ribbon-helix-helix protein n=1 Tax=Solidesulfovibrio alcoholivorans TaxID=81406 RepID=UPI001B80C6EA|nr:CopG family ribbon-helix-helix protein [Solidesulfovibrio alcoholivorans]